MLYNIFLFLFLIISALPSFSDAQIVWPNATLSNALTIETTDNIKLTNAWAGGFNSAQFSTFNADADTIKELFVFDKADDKILIFRNTNTSGSGPANWVFAPELIALFPDSLYSWARMYDYDYDGDEDLFTAWAGYIVYYKNLKSQTGKFELSKQTDTVFTAYNSYSLRSWLYTSRDDIMAMGDVDSDGDTDFLVYDVLGVSIEYHTNLAMERYGRKDTFDLRLECDRFGRFYELYNAVANRYYALLNADSCSVIWGRKTEEVAKTQRTQHSGGTLLLINLNGDSLMDVVTGDNGPTYLLGLYNGGTRKAALMTGIDSTFPETSTRAVDLTYYPAAYYHDVTNDGIADLIVTPNATTAIEDQQSVWMYRNTGTTNNPVFNFVQTDFLQQDMVDLGTGARPWVADLNGDSLPDLLVANSSFYRKPPQLPTGTLSYFENIGTRSRPAFKLIDKDYLGLSSVSGNGSDVYINLSPTGGDIDNDGDIDLIVGNNEGTLLFFENTGISGGVARFSSPVRNYNNIDIGDVSIPCLHDFDKDGDLDLFIGTRRGTVSFYANVGTRNMPRYRLITDTCGKILMRRYAPVNFNTARLSVMNLDSIGTVLVIGSATGQLEVFQLKGSPEDSFPYLGKLTNIDFGANPHPALFKTSSPDSTYLIVGTQRGGLHLVEMHAQKTVSIPHQPAVHTVAALPVRIYPNPTGATDGVWLAAPTGTRVTIYNSLGQIVGTERIFSSDGKQWYPITGWGQGLYWCHFHLPDQRQFTEKIQVQE